MNLITGGTLLGLMVALAAARIEAADKAGPAGPVTLYAKNCQSCHGPDGKGNPKMVKALKVDAAQLDLVDAASLKDTEWIKDITEGIKPKMPAYGKKLTADQIKELVAFIRGLAKPAK